ncbi:hypothetical protein F5X68DRAFT_279548 [Plectosphaerella plurivora]|uniref:glutathione transferase n=1 Tax=Plectosphaerella plurivora TaxID=936078 RepID=A0A9P9A5Q2_9PEZI|nr:hypothetical protein F5X68DRAFT_279548 [Plectosphaerella plurivora]
MSRITLFTDSRFPCPRRLELVIVELGLTINETREFDVFKREQKTPELEKLNPSGAVPFIQDDTYDPPLVLAESRAIARYLVRQYGQGQPTEKSLVPDPQDTRAWAAFEEAASIEQTAFDVAANPLVFEEYFKPKYMGRSPDAEKSQALKQRLSTALDVLDKKLSKTKFMAGDLDE